MKIVPVDEIPKPESSISLPDNLIEVYNTALKMQELCELEGGIGLSAFQVGIPWKMFVVKNTLTNKYDCYVDCAYFGESEKVLSIEGCLSLKDSNGNLQYYNMVRFEKIKVLGQQLIVDSDSPLLRQFEKELTGFDAIVFQHEIDHQNGILISDCGKLIYMW